MIRCEGCGFSSVDFRDFKTTIIPFPRGRKIDPNISDRNKLFVVLEGNFVSFRCPKCKTLYTTKPSEITLISLQTKGQGD